jgi:diphosphomevalonate decarboxylase
MKTALAARDFEAVGELAERSALAMHANSIAAGTVYFSGVTIEALAAVRALRARGTPVYATIDAGPHVKVLCRPDDAALAGTWMRAVPGVLRVIECSPGEGARLVSGSEGAA